DDVPEELSYLQLLDALGFETGHRRPLPLSDNVMYLDTECIYRPRDYVFIADRMRALAHPYLPLKNIRARFDQPKGKGYLSFQLGRKKLTWTVQLNNDWVDDSVFGRFALLLASRESPKWFTFHYLHGQDCLIGCATPEQVQQLKARTKVWFAWLGDGLKPA